MNKKKQIISLFILGAILLLITFYLIDEYKEPNLVYMDEPSDPLPTPTLIPASDKEEIDSTLDAINEDTEEIQDEEVFAHKSTLDVDSLPHDKLFITSERQNYKDNEITLIIPKLNFNEAIKNGTTTELLNEGPGLYEYSQLPGEGNRNVSIAAHRNKSRSGVISEWFFYYIDTLTDKDYLYLVDADYIYEYEYDQTTVVEPYDWSPIYSQGFSCLTLTSCEPIGISTHRIIVRSKLVKIYPYSDTFEYKENGL